MLRLREEDKNTREHWDEHWSSIGEYVIGVSILTDRLDEMAAKIQPTDMVLDVGGGRGEVALYIRRKTNCHITVAEISASGVAECRKRFIPAIECDYRKLHKYVLPGAYNVVLAGELLEHAADPAELIRQMIFACKPGGWLTLTTPITERWDHEPTHLWRFEPQDVVDLLEPHGRVELVYLNNGADHPTMLVAHCELGRKFPRAEEIPGWMYANDLAWLANEAKTKNVIVEVGSYQGRSTRALGENVRKKVYAFDDWNESHNLDDVPSLAGFYDPSSCLTLFESFCANLADLIQEGKIIPIRTDHARVPELPELADMVFIDGDHHYENVKRDILTWLPRLRSGGLLCGHDSHIVEVMQAVNECLGRVETVPDYIWHWTKP